MEKTFQKIDKSFWKLFKNIKTTFQPKKNNTSNTSELKTITEKPTPEIKPPIIESLDDNNDNNDNDTIDYTDTRINDGFVTPIFPFIVSEAEFNKILKHEKKNNEFKELIEIIGNIIMPALKENGFTPLVVPYPMFNGTYSECDLNFNIDERWREWINNKYFIFIIKLTEEHNIDYNLNIYVNHPDLNSIEKIQICHLFKKHLPYNTIWNGLHTDKINITYIKSTIAFEIPSNIKNDDTYPIISIFCNHQLNETNKTAESYIRINPELYTEFNTLFKILTDNCKMHECSYNYNDFEIYMFCVKDTENTLLQIRATLNNLHINDTIIQYHGFLYQKQDDKGTRFDSPDKINNSYIKYIYDLAKNYSNIIKY